MVRCPQQLKLSENILYEKAEELAKYTVKYLRNIWNVINISGDHMLHLNVNTDRNTRKMTPGLDIFELHLKFKLVSYINILFKHF